MGIRLTVSVRGSVPLIRADAAMRRANERIAGLGTKAARLRLQRHNRTGETSRSFRASVQGSRGVEWTDTAPQATFLEEGTRPHVIRPRRAKALRFLNPAGDVIFAKVVHHPGTRAQPWLEPAIANSADDFEDLYASEVEQEWSR